MANAQDYGLYFNGSVRKSLIGFSDMFNEIYTVVDAPDPTNRNNRIIQNYLIPIRLTTQERFLAFYRNVDQRRQIGIVLPVIGFNINSLAIDNDRTKLPMNKVYSTDGVEVIFQPIPTTLNIEMNVWTKTISEMLDIIEWIVPNYQTPQSYPLIEMKFFDGSNIQRDMIVSLDSPSLNITDTDLNAQDGDRIIQSSLTFTVTSSLYHIIVNNLGSRKGSFNGTGNAGYRGTGGATLDNGGTLPLGVAGSNLTGKGVNVINIDFENMIGQKWEALQLDSSGGKIIGNP